MGRQGGQGSGRNGAAGWAGSSTGTGCSEPLIRGRQGHPAWRRSVGPPPYPQPERLAIPSTFPVYRRRRGGLNSSKCPQSGCSGGAEGTANGWPARPALHRNGGRAGCPGSTSHSGDFSLTTRGALSRAARQGTQPAAAQQGGRRAVLLARQRAWGMATGWA